MPKTMQGYAQRARIAPTSRFRPQTWQTMQSLTPWIMLVVCTITVFFSPVLSVIFFFCGLLFYMMAFTWIPKPVFEVKPKDQTVHLGTDEYGLPVLMPVKAMLQHMLLIGTTGSGKTTTIRTMAQNLMKLGGGYCFIDGKADTTDTYAVLYEIIKEVDREEDLLVLNFLNPMQSHTFNFMLYGDADFLGEVISGFLQESQGDNAYWQGKARVLMKAILSCLVFKRDNKGKFPEFGMSISEIRKYFALQELIRMADDSRIPLHNEKTGNPVRQRLMNYLNELGPWRELNSNKPSPAASEVVRQHGFYVQQWGEPFDLLSGVFGKIFDSPEPDIDIVDVVTNSRILVVLLPSLSYSLGTLKGLGRTVLNTFKIALTTGLGKEIEGKREEIEMRVKRNRPSVPFMLVADEYGSYAVEGFDTVLAQARSLGMAVMISVQELASLFKASESDAKRLLGNTNIKMIMRLNDTDTAEYISKRAGEEFFLTPGASGQGGLVESVGNWDGQYQYQKNARVDVRDLMSQEIGEGFFVYGDDVRKYRTKYIPDKKTVKEMRLMKFIRYAVAKVSTSVANVFEDLFNPFNIKEFKLKEHFAIGWTEEKQMWVYKKAAKEYATDGLMEMGEVSFYNTATPAELINGGFLRMDEKQRKALEGIIEQRELFEKFKGELKVDMDKEKEWENVLKKPSPEANAFLQQAIYEIKQLKRPEKQVD